MIGWIFAILERPIFLGNSEGNIIDNNVWNIFFPSLIKDN